MLSESPCLPLYASDSCGRERARERARESERERESERAREREREMGFVWLTSHYVPVVSALNNLNSQCHAS